MEKKSGYQLRSLISKSASFFTPVSYGSIYPALKKLEENKLVTSEESIEKGRFIKTYTITEAGRKVIIEWLKTDLKPDIYRSDMLTRLFFYRNLLSLEDLISFVSDYINIQQTAHNEFSTIYNDAVNCAKMDTFHRYTLQFAIDHRKFLIEWYNKLLDELKTHGEEL